MRFPIFCVLILISDGVMRTQSDCLSIRGELNGKTRESRHFICNESANNSYTECDYFSVQLLKLQNCSVESIYSKFIEYQNVRTLDISFSNYNTELSKLILNFNHLNELNASYCNFTDSLSFLFFNKNN